MTQAAVLAASASPGTTTGFKNRVINGGMVISQGAAGATLTPATATAYATNYPVDRFFVAVSQASKLTTAQTNATGAALSTGFTKALNVTVTTGYSVGADEVFVLQQRIEGYNVADFQFGTSSAKTVTLSFWVNCSLTGTFGGSLLGASGTRAYPFSYTVSAANTWEQKTITIAGCPNGTWLTTNGNGLLLAWSLGVGSNLSTTANAWATGEYYNSTGSQSLVATTGATWNITGVQIEVGTTATNFDFRSITQETALCQRYYWKTAPANYIAFASGQFISSTRGSTYIKHPVTMRTAPTFGYTGTVYNSAASSNYTVSAILVAYTGYDSSRVDFTISGATAGQGLLAYTEAGSGDTVFASAEL